MLAFWRVVTPELDAVAQRASWSRLSLPALRAVGHDAGMPPTLRIGVLGAGPIAQFAHFEACRKAANAELYAICDVAPDLLEQVAAEHRPRRTFASTTTMLADPEVDAVIVAIADQFHVPAALQALAAGKHVLVEKPLGVTVEECEALVRAVERAGSALQVGTMRRFDPASHSRSGSSREELGDVAGAEGLVLRLGLSLHDDRRAAAHPAHQRAGAAAVRETPRPTAAATDARPRQPPHRPGAVPGGRHRERLGAARRRGAFIAGSWRATSRAVPPATST